MPNPVALVAFTRALRVKIEAKATPYADSDCNKNNTSEGCIKYATRSVKICSLLLGIPIQRNARSQIMISKMPGCFTSIWSNMPKVSD